MKLCGNLSAASEERGREWMVSLLGRLELGVSCRLRAWFTIYLRNALNSVSIFVGPRQCVAIDAESRWEDDRTALYAESLLESFAENLDGVSTLPAAFRIVDARLAPSS